MFGKSAWFRTKRVGWGVRPVCWQGWLYAVLWVAVIGLPFIGLMLSDLWFESLIWTAVMMGALVWDVRQVRRALETPASSLEEPVDVLFIDENTAPDPAYFATRSYDLHARR
jgi:hypothetical protein